MFLRVSASFLVAAALVGAADIQGAVRIARKLTRYNVTASAGIYQRGSSVELGDDPEKDPVAFELSHVAIYLEGGPAGKDSQPVEAAVEHKPVEATIEIEQKNRRFVPDLVVIPLGSTVSFPNSDPIFHNVFSLSRTRNFDLGNYPKGKTRVVTFPEPGVVAVYCHLHPNMEASIVVTPGSWGTRVSGDGRFELKNVPAGSYTVVAWHRVAGTFRKKIDLAADGVAEVEFVLPELEPASAKTIATR
jgi:plastocyanin